MSEPMGGGAEAERLRAADAPAGSGPEPASRWEDFIDIFYTPSTVFARRATSGFFLPMVIVTLAAGALFLVNSGVWSQVMEAEMTRALARQSRTLSPEQLERARAIGGTISKIGVLAFIPIGIFFTGLALWLVGKLFEAKETFGQALMIASYAYLPRVVEGIATSIQGLVLDPSTFTGRWKLSLGLGRFLDPDTASPVLLALLARVDVFTLWVTVLLAIGLAVVGRIPRSRAAIAGALVWVLGAVPLLLQARR
ncbi:MAG TPA: Yip1 family protein [Gemmatimonadaceae bacterium]|nr:Yip1 family protein [Gemmatimonadaceae bacterium]